MSDRRWFWVVKLVISTALVTYILWWVPWPDMASSLRSANLALVALAFGLNAVVVWLFSVQMKVLFDATGVELPLARVVWVNLVVEFYSFFLPGYALAGALRWYRFTRLGAPSMTTLAVLFLNRLINTTLVALTAVICLWLTPALASDRFLTATVVIVSFAFLTVLYTAFHPLLAASVGRFAARRTGPRTLGRIAERVVELSKTAEILGSLERRSRIVVYGVCLVRQVIGITIAYLLAVALAIEISWIEIGLVRAVAILLTTIPVSVAGVGVREGGLIYMLTRFGVEPGPAVAFSLLLLARDLLVRVIGGLLEAREHVGVRGAK